MSIKTVNQLSVYFSAHNLTIPIQYLSKPVNTGVGEGEVEIR
jgi:hypothetical protein